MSRRPEQSRLASGAVWLLPGAAIAVLVAACGDGGTKHPGAFFPTDPGGRGYVRVRDCRAPGEHSALGGFTVWVDPASAEAFESLWDGDQSRMPGGAVVMKVIHSDPGCTADEVLGYVAMKKVPGFDPAGGDWRWQQIDQTGDLIVDGKDASCSGCHEGRASCTGYGNEAGLDYLCTEP